MLPGLLLVSAAMAEPAAFSLMPFGVDLYLRKKPGRGVLYTVTQAAGLATAIYGTIQSDKAIFEEDVEAGILWKVVTASGVTTGGASYLISVVDGSNLHMKEQTAWLQEWDRDRLALAPPLGVETPFAEVARANRRE